MLHLTANELKFLYIFQKLKNFNIFKWQVNYIIKQNQIMKKCPRIIEIKLLTKKN